MSEVMVARQAIFDRDLQVVGYELLHRDVDRSRALVHDGNRATAGTLMRAFVDFGLEHLVGQGLAFFNLTRDSVLGVAELQLPIDTVVLEVLEDVVADERVLDALRQLAALGYIIALDDFTYRPQLAPLLEFAAIVKVDVLATPREQIPELLEILRPYPARLLAEKVETHEDLEYYRAAGFDYFQGYFLSRPKLVQGPRAPAEGLTDLELLARVTDPALDLEGMEELISRDVSLSYQFLRYINSAFFSWPIQLRSIRQSLILLGEQGVRYWLLLVAMSAVNRKPSELVTIALIRARTCQALAAGCQQLDPDTCFTVGLFSVIDALTDLPMADAVAALPLADELVVALSSGEGPLADVLGRVLAYERGDLAQVRDVQAVGEAYVEAITWGDRLTQATAA